MKKFCSLVLFAATLLVVTAGLSWAQAPQPALNVPTTEVYGGFVETSPDYGAHFDSFLLHGFEGAFSKGLSERLWITASADYVWGTSFNVKQFSGTVGPKFYVWTKRIRPYATGQVGYARQSSNGFYAGDHHPPFPPGTHTVESGFTYRVGGGVEWQFSPKLYWRILQWDIQPQPWARHTPFYTNIGSGIGYRF